MLKEIFITNLKRRKQAIKTTWRQIASDAGMNENYLYRLLSAGKTNVSLDTVERLARAVGMEAIELLRPSE